jgi:hypothetical protein
LDLYNTGLINPTLDFPIAIRAELISEIIP